MGVEAGARPRAGQRYRIVRLDLGKLPGYIARFALVFEHLKWAAGSDPVPPVRVSLEAVEAAVRFVDAYLKPMLRRTFGEAQTARPSGLQPCWRARSSSGVP